MHFTEWWKKVNAGVVLQTPSLYSKCEGNLYVFNWGATSAAIKKFDSVTEQWLSYTNVAYPEFNVPLNSFSVGRNMFFIGYDQTTQTGSIYKFSIDDQSWEKVRNLPVQISGFYHPYTFVIGENAFVGTQQGLYQYDMANDQWIQKKRLPTSRAEIRFPVSFSTNDNGYVSFSTDIIGSDERSEFWKYDMQTDTWSDLGRLPFSIFNGGTSTVYNNKVYLSGLSYRSGDKLMEYDFVTNQFKDMLPPPMNRSTNSITFLSGSAFYFSDSEWRYKIPLLDLKNIYR